MVSADYIQEHQEAMRRRLQDIMAFNRRKKIENSQTYIDEQKRRIRMAKTRQNRLQPEIVEILKPIAARYCLSLDELTFISRSRPAIRARKEGIVALYEAFPGRPTEWYTRPFGYVRGNSTVYYLRKTGRLPPLPTKGNTK